MGFNVWLQGHVGVSLGYRLLPAATTELRVLHETLSSAADRILCLPRLIVSSVSLGILVFDISKTNGKIELTSYQCKPLASHYPALVSRSPPQPRSPAPLDP